jgi:hypothetical protein
MIAADACSATYGVMQLYSSIGDAGSFYRSAWFRPLHQFVPGMVAEHSVAGSTQPLLWRPDYRQTHSCTC